MSKAPLSTSQARAAWYPPCHPVAPFAFWNGTRVSGDARVHPALAAMNTIMARHGYGPRQADTGMQVCRQITGGTGYSLHAYGIAIDVNWQSNPYFSYPASRAGHCDMPEAMVAEITALRTVNDAPVWGWGGNYRSIRDFMHYEIVCTPADLAAGIANAPDPGGFGTMTDDQITRLFSDQSKQADARFKALEAELGELREQAKRHNKAAQERDAKILAAVTAKVDG